MRKIFLIFASLVILHTVLAAFYYPPLLWSLLVLGPLLALGTYDFFQHRHAILRNYPILGHFRYLLEEIRPEIYQYFIESNTSGRPYHREDRSLIYQRAKGVLDTLPFGTQQNLYDIGYEWVNHSLRPTHVLPEALRVTIGGIDCKQPYQASILNISAMSYGSLSKNAIMALNRGAKIGGFAHNTGEGSISPYHQQGGDLIWQIGTGYFGCRTPEGKFCEETFADRAALPQVKMIEVKLSQGAKPGHGGILPGSKVTEEIAAIRGVPMGRDVLSPPGHTEFTTPLELLGFLQTLRERSGGKPVGFKLCVGKRREFIAICKAMIETGITPDFITVDGGEGGTGAAPLEFSNSIGSPLVEGLIFVSNCLTGFDLRHRIKIIASGKVSTGFGIIKRIAIGADVCCAARAMMMSLGCIQALKCNTNKCPTGVATQDPALIKGLIVEDKDKRVANFHKETVESVAEMLGAMGLHHTADLRPWHVVRRVSATKVRHYGELYRYVDPGSLLNEPYPEHYVRAMQSSASDTFEYRALHG